MPKSLTAHCNRCGTIAEPKDLILNIQGIGVELICDDCFEIMKNEHEKQAKPAPPVPKDNR